MVISKRLRSTEKDAVVAQVSKKQFVCNFLSSLQLFHGTGLYLCVVTPQLMKEFVCRNLLIDSKPQSFKATKKCRRTVSWNLIQTSSREWYNFSSSAAEYGWNYLWVYWITIVSLQFAAILLCGVAFRHCGCFVTWNNKRLFVLRSSNSTRRFLCQRRAFVQCYLFYSTAIPLCRRQQVWKVFLQLSSLRTLLSLRELMLFFSC